MKNIKRSPLDDLKFSKAKATRRTVIDDPTSKPIAKDEARLQAQCEEYLEIQKIDFIHIPNSAFRGDRTVASHYLKGWVDLIIFERDIKYNRNLMIELKTDTGDLSQGQKDRMKNLNYFVIRSLDDFIKEVGEFIND